MAADRRVDVIATAGVGRTCVIFTGLTEGRAQELQRLCPLCADWTPGRRQADDHPSDGQDRIAHAQD
jgi:hypothetical protein